jgi:UDP-N-acetylglucosamine--N-acetylmuramyl-(pentapeptide) pyrophosphoryl-undecaprenol N-acetylglucosamine transferase
VPQRLTAAHLVIAWAGASTVAELTALGRPSILIPYPFAIDDHQSANARALAATGAAWVLPQQDFDADALAARLAELLAGDGGELSKAAAAARAAGCPDAAARLANVVGSVSGVVGGSSTTIAGDPA